MLFYYNAHNIMSFALCNKCYIMILLSTNSLINHYYTRIINLLKKLK